MATTPAICTVTSCYITTSQCNRTASPCPTCLTPSSDIVMCSDASLGCDGGTVCAPLVSSPLLFNDSALPAATTLAPEEAAKNTVTYALLCGGLCCLVFVLYGVLRWSQAQKKREAALDSEATSAPHAQASALDSTYSLDKVPSLRPTPNKSLLDNNNHSNANSYTRKNTGGTVLHDDPATYSMFHTIGRISGVHKHRASSLLSQQKDSIIYIMEEEDDDKSLADE
ncbi:hypothetical protein SPRG_07231 [Saprolegnia parasitica CBS 223.65]|uniref:Uncharacterized protein n=1 Tax=Saprolegnia parasitica (strain CBS 223.65) TaxID=695850 RepID=A0A067CFJ4_SAPPC|nr:hypothetical protein SPRG_07231 [Saprolegnia parasitica CBS 223.65]KDO27955.1 hypothetical protein SPRG_07231 [Saprolegnia parasitica CBS 223.65]|eukprot:XP_012201405.1 hypothetical protein SPRG_07231 [Saprolegnia parasitica CBS 223.65]